MNSAKRIYPNIEKRTIIVEGLELNQNEQNIIHDMYEWLCTADYINDNYGTDMEKAYQIAIDIREIMECNGVDEDIAIEMYRKEREDFVNAV